MNQTLKEERPTYYWAMSRSHIAFICDSCVHASRCKQTNKRMILKWKNDLDLLTYICRLIIASSHMRMVLTMHLYYTRNVFSHAQQTWTIYHGYYVSVSAICYHIRISMRRSHQQKANSKSENSVGWRPIYSVLYILARNAWNRK